MKDIKISVIGAGSGAFSLQLIRDLCLTPSLAGSTVSFMDIDEQRLDAAHTLCTRYAAELGAGLSMEKTTDRRASLDGADFVVTTALSAPHERLRAGWEIARRHGYRWGGSYHVMYDEAFWINFYQLRLFESIAEDILQVCPSAWHLLVANPVLAGVTHLGRRYPNARTVGICHGSHAVYSVADILGLKRSDISFEVSGVNHFIYLTSLRARGVNGFRVLDEWIRDKSEDHWKTSTNDPLCPKLVDIYRRFGVLPIGDTASWSGASWPWWYHSDDATEKRWLQDPAWGWQDYFSHVEKNARDIQLWSADPNIRVSDCIPPDRSEEIMIPLIESIARDMPRVFITNIMNTRGLVEGVPENFQVELPTLVSGRGVQGMRTVPLPAAVRAHILRDRVAPVELELDAFIRGSREMLAELVLTDRWSVSEAQVGSFIDEILSLPYHAELREHYRKTGGL